MKHHLLTVKNGDIGWNVGDIIEIRIDGHKPFFVKGVPEPDPDSQCGGCLGDLLDEDGDSICNLLPNRCGLNTAIFVPACEVSSTMAALAILQDRRHKDD